MKIKKIHIIGFTVTIVLVLFIIGLNFLKGKYIFSSDNVYYAVYERIDGLTASSPVMINGYAVGKVRNITLLPDKSGRLLVEFAVDDNYRIPKQATAYIYSADLMGTKAVQLIFGESNEQHQNGDTLASRIEVDLMEQVNMQVLPIKNQAEKMMLSIDSVMTVIRTIFNEDAQLNLAKSIASIRSTITNLESTTYTLDNLLQGEQGHIAHILYNVDSVSTMLRNNSGNFERAIQNLAVTTDTIRALELSKSLKDLDKAVKDFDVLITEINEGQGSLGMLLHNDTLYMNLENATYNLNRLIKDINENPRRYAHFSIINLGRDKQKKEKDKKER